MAASRPPQARTQGQPAQGQAAARKPLVDLSEAEQWDIVEKSGVLHKVKGAPGTHNQGPSRKDAAHDQEPHVLVAVLMSIPMALFHGMLDYIVHHQYGFLDKFTWRHVASRQLPLIPSLVLFMYVTSRVKHSKVAQLLFAVAAVAAGNTLIYYTTVDETFGAMLKAPGLAVVWVYLVIQMDILPAILSLAGSLIYFHREYLMSIVRSNSFALHEDL
ncbi:hypothetical protein BC831DRAFT_440026 [Entophlyctis helioformis]|nr:hypothetical protein BC831DRAFT_440026 [Entophlyctis helioformis]